MASVGNIGRLLAKLKQRKLAAQNANCVVVVGFTQNYAVYVHENLQAHHPVGQAKFLEQPARQLKSVLPKQVARMLKAGYTLPQALIIAGMRLQREAQLLTPVDTGALRASAFTKRER